MAVKRERCMAMLSALRDTRAVLIKKAGGVSSLNRFSVVFLSKVMICGTKEPCLGILSVISIFKLLHPTLVIILPY